jgi:hypothetical protein
MVVLVMDNMLFGLCRRNPDFLGFIGTGMWVQRWHENACWLFAPLLFLRPLRSGRAATSSYR